MKSLKNNKGFTLIELIVVIAILGILSLIVVPKYGAYAERSKFEADKLSAKQIEKAILLEIASKGDLYLSDGTTKVVPTPTTSSTASPYKLNELELPGIDTNIKSQYKKCFIIYVENADSGRIVIRWGTTNGRGYNYVIPYGSNSTISSYIKESAVGDEVNP